MNAPALSKNVHLLNEEWQNNGLFFEYGSAANPRMPSIGIDVFPPALHQIAKSKIIPLQLSQQLETDYPATGPNLLANYIHIAAGEPLATGTHASSQVFYVIRGAGVSTINGSKALVQVVMRLIYYLSDCRMIFLIEFSRALHNLIRITRIIIIFVRRRVIIIDHIDI